MICPACHRRFAEGSARYCPADGRLLVPDDYPNDWLVGREIDGRYKLERRLGAGGMGVVYEAQHLLIDMKVAIKVVRERDQAFDRDLFFREAKILAELSHPAIVGIKDFGVADDVGPYCVMDLLVGRSLDEDLRAGPFEPRRAASIACTIADALIFAHRRGVVHRDLKPANVFLDVGSGTERVRLLDFGIARSIRQATVARAGCPMGTPAYMSPEQWTSAADVDARTDIYSLGATLFHMLTGRPPLDGTAEANAARGRNGLADRRPRQLCPEVPKWLDGVVDRAMAPKPEDRFRTAAELKSMLSLGLAVDSVKVPFRHALMIGGGLARLLIGGNSPRLEGPAHVRFPLPVDARNPALLFPIDMSHLGSKRDPKSMGHAVAAGVIAKYGKQVVSGQRFLEVVDALATELPDTLNRRAKSRNWTLDGDGVAISQRVDEAMELMHGRLCDLNLLADSTRFRFLLVLHSHGQYAMDAKMLKVDSFGGIYDLKARRIVAYQPSTNTMVNDDKALLGQLPLVFNDIIACLIRGHRR